MGAIFIYKTNSQPDLEAVTDLFQKKGFSQPNIFETDIYRILHYQKIRMQGANENFIRKDDDFMLCVGTIIYKKLNYSESLKSLYDDFNENSIKAQELLGTFFIVFRKNGNISYITDRSGIQNIFYTQDKNVISTSFLASIYSQSSPLTINKNALIEILTTGTLIGPETIFNEIRRLEETDDDRLDNFEKIKLDERKFTGYCQGTFDECVNDQISTLEKYFNSIKKIADNEGADSGLTGGHDSRLIMALGLKHFSKISFHSHWRNEKSVELDSAKKLAETAGVDLISISVKDPLEMSGEELDNNFLQCFLFFDGLSRMHSFWTEEYNTLSYRKKILNDNNLGLSGVGGEQYRNEERMNRDQWNLKNVIKYKILLYNCGECFINKEELDRVVGYIDKKIRKKLQLTTNEKIDHLIFKRYLNEVFIPARLGVRNNAENQLSFFLSPFTDHNVAVEAYKIVNKLGISYSFEESMINKIDPKLASVPSDHGFDFHKGEPFLNKIKAYIIDLIPMEILYKYYSKKMIKKNSRPQFEKLLEKSQYLREGVTLLDQLNLPIDLNKLAEKADLMPLILANGYLLKKLEGKINLN